MARDEVAETELAVKPTAGENLEENIDKMWKINNHARLMALHDYGNHDKRAIFFIFQLLSKD